MMRLRSRRCPALLSEIANTKQNHRLERKFNSGSHQAG